MQTWLENPAFRIYGLCSAIVCVHLLVLAGWTGYVRARRKSFLNPEDARLSNVKELELDHPDVRRVQRCHLNALENGVPFLALGLLYVIVGATKTGAQAYFFTYAGSRVVHSIFYLWGKQPFRTIFFAIGAFANIGMAYQIIRAVL
jgi:microsomal prostaglandin-E synthase 1